MTDSSVPEAERPGLDTSPPRQEWGRFFKELLETLLLAGVLFVAINLVSARVRVDGFSMLPSLDDSQYVLVSRLSYAFGEVHRGDVIVFRPPMYPEESFLRRLLGLPNFNDDYEDYIKRVIGLPGETVRIGNGRVTIDGVELIEPYISDPPRYSGEWTVPEGALFVLGDNRNNSEDSHHWGFLPVEDVLGKAILVYWPFSDWIILHSEVAALAAP